MNLKRKKLVIWSSVIGLSLITGVTATTVVLLQNRKVDVNLRSYDGSWIDLGTFKGKILEEEFAFPYSDIHKKIYIKDNDEFIKSFKKSKYYVPELDLVGELEYWEENAEKYYFQNDNDRFFFLTRKKGDNEWFLRTSSAKMANSLFTDSPFWVEPQKENNLYTHDFLLKFYSRIKDDRVEISNDKNSIKVKSFVTYGGTKNFSYCKPDLVDLEFKKDQSIKTTFDNFWESFKIEDSKHDSVRWCAERFEQGVYIDVE